MATIVTGLIQDLIVSQLTEYVDLEDENQCKFYGSILELKDAKIRTDIFQKIGMGSLPIRLKSGRIGGFKLRLDVMGMMRSRSEPVDVKIEDVVLICEPYGDFNDEEYVRTDKEARRGALDREDEAEAISLDTEAET